MPEGIGPAVESNRLAAESISQGEQYDLSLIKKYSSGNRLLNRVTANFSRCSINSLPC